MATDLHSLVPLASPAFPQPIFALTPCTAVSLACFCPGALGAPSATGPLHVLWPGRSSLSLFLLPFYLVNPSVKQCQAPLPTSLAVYPTKSRTVARI